MVAALTRPGAPRSVKATGGDGIVRLTWKAPASSGSRPIDGYRIQRKSGSTWKTVTTVAAAVRSFTVSGLLNGTTQRVRIAAVSAAGAGSTVATKVVLPAALDVGTDSGIQNLDPNLSCAVTPARRVRCWGANNHGQLGFGSVTPSVIGVPIDVVGLTGVAEVGVGGEYACARTQKGTVWCWGSDGYNQLPARNGGATTPYQVPGITTAVALDVGVAHACVLLKDHTMRCFGSNGFGELGSGDTQGHDVVDPGITDVKQFSLGDNHTCAVQMNGYVRAGLELVQPFLRPAEHRHVHRAR